MTTRSTIFVTLATFLCLSCTDGSEAKSPNESQSSDTHIEAIIDTSTVNKEIESDESPVGFWEVNKTLPTVSIAKAPLSENKINLSLQALSEHFACDNGGDQTFLSEVLHNGSGSLSIKYEAMWLCATMPSPDSMAGIISYDLASGRELVLNTDGLKGNEAELHEKVISAATKQKDDIAPCDKFPKFNFAYPAGDTTAFTYLNPNHGDTSCDYSVSLNNQLLLAMLADGKIFVVD